MSELIRSFIAVELNEAIHKELTILENNLKSSQADVKWVEPTSIHLTLKFLGNINEEQLNQIKLILDNIISPEKSFNIRLSGMGAFPKIGFPRVVWVGIKDGNEELSKIVDMLEAQLHRIGFPKENRPFSPHLTLGRLRSTKGKDKLIELLKNSSFESAIYETIDHITLFKSTLTSKGSIYTPLYKSTFSK